MRKIMVIAVAAACALALTACGGDGGDNDSTSTRTDEGIWGYASSADQNGNQNVVQTVILSDGSYWGVYGNIFGAGCFQADSILHGTASVSGSNASGAYIDFNSIFESFGMSNSVPINGTYAGTVSTKNNLNLTFNDGSTSIGDISSLSDINMSYDGIYNQPASLSSIAGNYQESLNGCVDAGSGLIPASAPGEATPQSPIQSVSYSLSISGSNLSLAQSYNGSTNVIMTGTIAPHGTAVNVFDVNLETTANAAATGSVLNGPGIILYTGILFQTSGVLKNNIEIVATSGDGSALFYMGTK